jgi:hypothetical protein
MEEGEEEVCGFASCSHGEEGCHGRGEVNPKSRKKGDAQEEGQEKILPTLIQTNDANALE